MIAAFEARIERGIAEGNVSRHTDLVALTRFVGVLVQGMSVQAEDGATEAVLLGIAGMAGAKLARYGATPA